MEVRIADCPLGAKCEEVKPDEPQILLRCPWYVKVEGKNPQSEEQFDEWRCAIAWMPILTVESSQQTRGVQHAVEDFRNQSVAGQEEFIGLIENRQRQRLKG